jgi:hypothetical protein
MPSTERFQARPMGACSESCPLNEITSFELDSSRSRKFVVDLVHMVSFPTVPIASRIVISDKLYFRSVFDGFGSP